MAISGKPWALVFCEVEGEMPGLISRAALAQLHVVWDSGSQLVDLRTLNIKQVQLVEHDNGSMLMDLLQFGNMNVQKTKIYEDYLMTEEKVEQEAMIADDCKAKATEHGTCMAVALAEGRKQHEEEAVILHSALPGAVRRQAVKSVKALEQCLAALRYVGDTFVWELFAGKHMVTRLPSQAGHYTGQLLDASSASICQSPGCRSSC